MKIEEMEVQITPLERDTKVRIMLPEGYESQNKRYPVLYINDGQDVFRDDQTYGDNQSLRYEEYYRDYKKFLPDIILVAICAPKDSAIRTRQYSPFTKSFEVPEGKSFEPIIKGEGILYLNWMTTELKSIIDEKYRTYPDPDNTAICGYSTGGLNSVYALLKYSHVFHRGIVISAAVAIWMDCLEESLETGDYQNLQRVYLDTGTNEFGRMSTKKDFLRGTETIYQYFKNNGLTPEKLKYKVFPDATHSQKDWSLRFPDAIRWIFPEY